ncbi:TadE/TadG family type IV pilus assembly protein [Sphingomonas bacterium]|uniref:TadE/TadG family type IV pilus assembly protein n=1 Tax=Sphingomonas bacterium TaxID=1895847 RepID=UPI001575D7C8|nr:TadE/TadG family type IV pilus assembly protein [Sphingomonas bacterium]
MRRRWLIGGAAGFLARLRRDQRGNTLAMMAAMMIPLAGLSGSAIDMGRLYTVKSRLQQACDAGVLAGRKFMIDSNSSTLDTAATAQANAFFTNNFKAGWYKVSSVSFTPSKTSDNQVSGTATATVPMTIMAMFGIGSKAITVACQAQYDVADTDVVFVLDTTGSMACLPADSDDDCSTYVGQQVSSNAIVKYSRPGDSALGASSGSVNSSVPGYPGSIGFYVPEKSGSRIAALRTAVVNFYNTLASTADASTHIRYGFVTYTSTVNAGRAVMDISPSYMVGGSGNALKTWAYQSRKPTGDYVLSSSTTTRSASSSANCATSAIARNPSTLYTYNSSGQATETKAVYDTSKSPNCTMTAYTYGPVWTYQPVSFDVSNFLTTASVDDPSRVDNGTAQWQGCLEERNTSGGTSTFDSNALPADLDPDLIPDATSATGATSWRPMWPEVIYGRNYDGSSTTYGSTANTTSNGDTTNIATALSYFNYAQSGIQNYLLRAGWAVCGKPIRRVATMSQADVTNYVNASDFRAIGGTYHDTGMIWGVRLLSRLGIFASDNQSWPGRLPPNRVIVFLTDGDMAPSLAAYGMYGVEYFDKRVTNGSYANQKAYHNARFLAECSKAKKMNVSVWTISIAPSVTTEMQQCATTSAQALYTTSGGDLSAKFGAIAKQVAMLRISK